MADHFESVQSSDEPETLDVLSTPMSTATEPVQPADSTPRVVTSWHILSLLVFLMTLLLFVAAYLRSEQKPVIAGTGPAAPPPVLSPDEVRDAEVAGLKVQIDHLSAELQGVQRKVDAVPKPAPPTDLSPIRGKVDELGNSVAAVMPVVESVGALSKRVGGIDVEIKAELSSLKEQISGLTTEIQKLAVAKPVPAEPVAETSPPAVVAEATNSPADAEAPTLSEGIDFFKAGKFKEAGDVFKKLESTQSNDARVYYYEAFVNGLTTKDWKGETLKLATKGAELEKSGATKSADIDAAFSELPPNLKSWLTFFRRQAR